MTHDHFRRVNIRVVYSTYIELTDLAWTQFHLDRVWGSHRQH
jgi:hypothetical protein